VNGWCGGGIGKHQTRKRCLISKLGYEDNDISVKMRRASARPATTSSRVAPTGYSGGRIVYRDVTEPAPPSRSFDDGGSRYLLPADQRCRRHRSSSRPWPSQPSTAAARPTTSVVVFVAVVRLLCAVRSVCGVSVDCRNDWAAAFVTIIIISSSPG